MSFAEYRPGRARDPLPVVVRAALPADVEALVAVQHAAGRTVDADALGRAIANPDRCVLLAEPRAAAGSTAADRAARGRPVLGWALTHRRTEPADDADPAPPGHYLGGVTVHPDHRRRGVAVALTDARMRWVAARPDHEGAVYYVVNPANRASIALHERWGFREVMRADRLAGVTFTGGVGILMRAEPR